MEKTNDWIVSNIAIKPQGFGDLMDNGVMPSNVTLQSKDFYKEKKTIQNAFTKDGKFDDKAYDQFYNAQVAQYNQFQKTDPMIYRENIPLVSDTLSNRRAGLKFRKNPIQISSLDSSASLRMAMGQKLNVGTEGWSDSIKTMSELAQSQKIVDHKTGSILDATPEDITLENGFGFLRDPLVLAEYDEDIIDSNGNKIHKKGEVKLNDLGLPYYETLGNRKKAGKKQLSAWDTLTPENSAFNKIDFLDSDDYKKSTFGSLMKMGAMAGVALIPGVGEGLMYTYVGLNFLDAGLEIGKSVDAIINGEETNEGDFYNAANKFQGYLGNFKLNQSEYANENFFSFENIGNMMVDSLYQLKGQKLISQIPGKLLLPGFEKIARGKVASQTGALKGMGIADDVVEEIGKSLFDKEMVASKVLSAATGSLLATTYMASTSALSIRDAATQLGLNNRDTALLYLGFMGTLAPLFRSNIGSWVEEKYDISKIAQHSNKIVLDQAKRFAIESADEVAEVGLKGGYSKALKLGKQLGEGLKNNLEGTSMKSILVGAAAESFEEITEFALEKSIQAVYNGFVDLGFTSTAEKKKFEFDPKTMAYELMATAVGGALGGALFKGVDTFESRNQKTGLEDKNLSEAIVAGREDLLFESIDDLEKRGMFGSRNLSIDVSDGTDAKDVIWNPVNDQHKVSHNSFVADQMRKMVTAMVEMRNINGIDPSMRTSRKYTEGFYNNVIDTGTDTFMIDDINSVTKEIFSLKNQIQTTLAKNPEFANTTTFKDLNDQLDKAKQQLADIQSGKKADEYLRQGLFNIRTDTRQAYNIKTRQDFAKDLYPLKSYSELSSDELDKVEAKYQEYRKNGMKDDLVRGRIEYEKQMEIVQQNKDEIKNYVEGLKKSINAFAADPNVQGLMDVMSRIEEYSASNEIDPTTGKKRVPIPAIDFRTFTPNFKGTNTGDLVVELNKVLNSLDTLPQELADSMKIKLNDIRETTHKSFMDNISPMKKAIEIMNSVQGQGFKLYSAAGNALDLNVLKSYLEQFEQKNYTKLSEFLASDYATATIGIEKGSKHEIILTNGVNDSNIDEVFNMINTGDEIYFSTLSKVTYEELNQLNSDEYLLEDNTKDAFFASLQEVLENRPGEVTNLYNLIAKGNIVISTNDSTQLSFAMAIQNFIDNTSLSKEDRAEKITEYFKTTLSKDQYLSFIKGVVDNINGTSVSAGATRRTDIDYLTDYIKFEKEDYLKRILSIPGISKKIILDPDPDVNEKLLTTLFLGANNDFELSKIIADTATPQEIKQFIGYANTDPNNDDVLKLFTPKQLRELLQFDVAEDESKTYFQTTDLGNSVEFETVVEQLTQNAQSGEKVLDHSEINQNISKKTANNIVATLVPSVKQLINTEFNRLVNGGIESYMDASTDFQNKLDDVLKELGKLDAIMTGLTEFNPLVNNFRALNPNGVLEESVAKERLVTITDEDRSNIQTEIKYYSDRIKYFRDVNRANLDNKLGFIRKQQGNFTALRGAALIAFVEQNSAIFSGTSIGIDLKNANKFINLKEYIRARKKTKQPNIDIEVLKKAIAELVEIETRLYDSYKDFSEGQREKLFAALDIKVDAYDYNRSNKDVDTSTEQLSSALLHDYLHDVFIVRSIDFHSNLAGNPVKDSNGDTYMNLQLSKYAPFVTQENAIRTAMESLSPRTEIKKHKLETGYNKGQAHKLEISTMGVVSGLAGSGKTTAVASSLIRATNTLVEGDEDKNKLGLFGPEQRHVDTLTSELSEFKSQVKATGTMNGLYEFFGDGNLRTKIEKIDLEKNPEGHMVINKDAIDKLVEEYFTNVNGKLMAVDQIIIDEFTKFDARFLYFMNRMIERHISDKKHGIVVTLLGDTRQMGHKINPVDYLRLNISTPLDSQLRSSFSTVDATMRQIDEKFMMFNEEAVKNASNAMSTNATAPIEARYGYIDVTQGNIPYRKFTGVLPTSNYSDISRITDSFKSEYSYANANNGKLPTLVYIVKDDGEKAGAIARLKTNLAGSYDAYDREGLIKVYTEDEIQGGEFDYVIVDDKHNFSDKSPQGFLNAIKYYNTMLSRGRTATLLIQTSPNVGSNVIRFTSTQDHKPTVQFAINPNDENGAKTIESFKEDRLKIVKAILDNKNVKPENQLAILNETQLANKVSSVQRNILQYSLVTMNERNKHTFFTGNGTRLNSDDPKQMEDLQALSYGFYISQNDIDNYNASQSTNKSAEEVRREINSLKSFLFRLNTDLNQTNKALFANLDFRGARVKMIAKRYDSQKDKYVGADADEDLALREGDVFIYYKIVIPKTDGSPNLEFTLSVGKNLNVHVFDPKTGSIVTNRYREALATNQPEYYKLMYTMYNTILGKINPSDLATTIEIADIDPDKFLGSGSSFNPKPIFKKINIDGSDAMTYEKLVNEYGGHYIISPPAIMNSLPEKNNMFDKQMQNLVGSLVTFVSAYVSDYKGLSEDDLFTIYKKQLELYKNKTSAEVKAIMSSPQSIIVVGGRNVQVRPHGVQMIKLDTAKTTLWDLINKKLQPLLISIKKMDASTDAQKQAAFRAGMDLAMSDHVKNRFIRALQISRDYLKKVKDERSMGNVPRYDDFNIGMIDQQGKVSLENHPLSEIAEYYNIDPSQVSGGKILSDLMRDFSSNSFDVDAVLNFIESILNEQGLIGNTLRIGNEIIVDKEGTELKSINTYKLIKQLSADSNKVLLQDLSALFIYLGADKAMGNRFGFSIENLFSNGLISLNISASAVDNQAYRDDNRGLIVMNQNLVDNSEIVTNLHALTLPPILLDFKDPIILDSIEKSLDIKMEDVKKQAVIIQERITRQNGGSTRVVATPTGQKKASTGQVTIDGKKVNLSNIEEEYNKVLEGFKNTNSNFYSFHTTLRDSINSNKRMSASQKNKYLSLILKNMIKVRDGSRPNSVKGIDVAKYLNRNVLNKIYVDAKGKVFTSRVKGKNFKKYKWNSNGSRKQRFTKVNWKYGSRFKRYMKVKDNKSGKYRYWDKKTGIMINQSAFEKVVKKYLDAERLIPINKNDPPEVKIYKNLINDIYKFSIGSTGILQSGTGSSYLISNAEAKSRVFTDEFVEKVDEIDKLSIPLDQKMEKIRELFLKQPLVVEGSANNLSHNDVKMFSINADGHIVQAKAFLLAGMKINNRKTPDGKYVLKNSNGFQFSIDSSVTMNTVELGNAGPTVIQGFVLNPDNKTFIQITESGIGEIISLDGNDPNMDITTLNNNIQAFRRMYKAYLENVVKFNPKLAADAQIIINAMLGSDTELDALIQEITASSPIKITNVSGMSHMKNQFYNLALQLKDAKFASFIYGELKAFQGDDILPLTAMLTDACQRYGFDQKLNFVNHGKSLSDMIGFKFEGNNFVKTSPKQLIEEFNKTTSIATEFYYFPVLNGDAILAVDPAGASAYFLDPKDKIVKLVSTSSNNSIFGPGVSFIDQHSTIEYMLFEKELNDVLSDKNKLQEVQDKLLKFIPAIHNIPYFKRYVLMLEKNLQRHGIQIDWATKKMTQQQVKQNMINNGPGININVSKSPVDIMKELLNMAMSKDSELEDYINSITDDSQAQIIIDILNDSTNGFMTKRGKAKATKGDIKRLKGMLNIGQVSNAPQMSVQIKEALNLFTIVESSIKNKSINLNQNQIAALDSLKNAIIDGSFKISDGDLITLSGVIPQFVMHGIVQDYRNLIAKFKTKC